jgi:hypothetical protein
MAICLGGLEEEARSLIARHADTAGIYCVLDNSVGPHIDLLKFAATGDPKDYARYVSPKWGLQSSLGIAASSLSIILGTRGGVQVFHHSRDAGLHAIQQAELDLETGAVSLAVVCSASSADDPMTLLKHRTLHPELRYSEGAAVMLLEAGVGQLNYGIANDLIKFTLGDRHAA